MQNRKIKYIGLALFASATLLFTGCVPVNNYGYNGYRNPVVASSYIGIYDYPRYMDSPYYYYNNRYYYGGYYRDGYYYHRGHRYRNGRYYNRGYRYHHRRHVQNRDLLKEDHRSRHRRSYRRSDNYRVDHDSYRSNVDYEKSYRSHRSRNVNLLRRKH